MTDLCMSYYCITGDKNEIMDLDRRMEKIEHDSGNTLLGDLVESMGGNRNEIFCSGEWTEREFTGEILYVTIVSAWKEPEDFRKFIKSRYRSTRILYYSQSENGICKTNDKDGEFFDFRYKLEYDGNEEYFEDIDDAAGFIEELTGIKIGERTEEAVRNVLSGFSESKNGFSCSLYKFEICEDII